MRRSIHARTRDHVFYQRKVDNKLAEVDIICTITTTNSGMLLYGQLC